MSPKTISSNSWLDPLFMHTKNTKCAWPLSRHTNLHWQRCDQNYNRRSMQRVARSRTMVRGGNHCQGAVGAAYYLKYALARTGAGGSACCSPFTLSSLFIALPHSAISHSTAIVYNEIATPTVFAEFELGACSTNDEHQRDVNGRVQSPTCSR